MDKLFEALSRTKSEIIDGFPTGNLWVGMTPEELDAIKQALQRLNKYEQILSSGRLTDRNYKNTTLDLDSCKPYLRLGQLEDIYEKNKKGK